mmetsp:Transcript_104439/g.302176  ORF Transcript_104439/g.302176 Transcript_104439/m.302176 type:complete len:543 (-) Transcript_104439:2395-4023(-)
MVAERAAVPHRASSPGSSSCGGGNSVEEDVDFSNDDVALQTFDLLASSFRNVPDLYRLAYKSQHSKLEAAIDAQQQLRKDVDRIELNLRKTQEQSTNQMKKIKETITEIAEHVSSRRRRSMRRDQSRADGGTPDAKAMRTSSKNESGSGGLLDDGEGDASSTRNHRALSVFAPQNTSRFRHSLTEMSESSVGIQGSGLISDDDSECNCLTQEDRRRLDNIDYLDKRITSAHQSLRNLHTQGEKARKVQDKLTQMLTQVEERVFGPLSEANFKDNVREIATAAIPRWLASIGAIDDDTEDGVADAFREGRETREKLAAEAQRHAEDMEAIDLRLLRLEAEVFDNPSTTISSEDMEAAMQQGVDPAFMSDIPEGPSSQGPGSHGPDRAGPGASAAELAGSRSAAIGDQGAAAPESPADAASRPPSSLSPSRGSPSPSPSGARTPQRGRGRGLGRPWGAAEGRGRRCGHGDTVVPLGCAGVVHGAHKLHPPVHTGHCELQCERARPRPRDAPPKLRGAYHVQVHLPVVRRGQHQCLGRNSGRAGR